MRRVLLILPYDIRRNSGTPLRFQKLKALLESQEECKVEVLSTSLMSDHLNFRLRILRLGVVGLLWIQIQIFYHLLKYRRYDLILCGTCEAGFVPVMLSNINLIRSTKVVVDVHGLVRDEHKITISTIFLRLIDYYVLNRGKNFLFVAQPLKKYLNSESVSLFAPFVFHSEFTCPAKKNTNILYFGGGQEWQGLGLVDKITDQTNRSRLCFAGSCVTKFNGRFKSLGINPNSNELNKYAGFGISFRNNLHTESSQISSKITTYIESGLVPVAPYNSNEFNALSKYGVVGFETSTDGFSDLLERIDGMNDETYIKILETLFAYSRICNGDILNFLGV